MTTEKTKPGILVLHLIHLDPPIRYVDGGITRYIVNTTRDGKVGATGGGFATREAAQHYLDGASWALWTQKVEHARVTPWDDEPDGLEDEGGAGYDGDREDFHADG